MPPTFALMSNSKELSDARQRQGRALSHQHRKPRSVSGFGSSEHRSKGSLVSIDRYSGGSRVENGLVKKVT